MGLEEGIRLGQATEGPLDPFAALAQGIAASKERRRKEDALRAKEEQELEDQFSILKKKHDLDVQLAKEKSDIKLGQKVSSRGGFDISRPLGVDQVGAQPTAQGLLGVSGISPKETGEGMFKKDSKGNIFFLPETQDERLKRKREKLVDLQIESKERGTPFPAKQLEDLFTRLDTINSITTNVDLLLKNKDKFGKFLGPFGTKAPVKRFVSKFDKSKGAERSFISNIEQTAQIYRVLITGAQAGFNEIRFLRSIFPSADDLPEAFVAKSFLASQTVKNALERQIPILKAQGTNTLAMEESLKTIKEQLNVMKKSLSKEEFDKLSQSFDFAQGSDFEINPEELVSEVGGFGQDLEDDSFGKVSSGNTFTIVEE